MHVVVIGAGPSGLLLALMLGREGIQVTVLEAGESIDKRPRATHYGAPAVRELRRAGVLEEVRKKGFIPGTGGWRKLDGTPIVLAPRAVGDHPDALTCLPLDKLGDVMKEHVDALPNVEIKFKHKVINVGQDDTSAWAEVQLADGSMAMVKGDYLVGCDGGNSQVRKCLFGDRFPGFTWDQQVVATNVYYDFKKFGYTDGQFMIHPDHWHMVARIGNDDFWRVSYGELTGLSNEELIKRQPYKYEMMLPGHPKPDSGLYKVTNIGPYKVHQRCVEHMTVGRIMLAADAAHLCNPFGGMGLTGGIVDIGGLFDCLNGIYIGEADHSILLKYDEIRRQKYDEVVNPVSSANIRRLFELDPDKALEQDPFLKALDEAVKAGPEALQKINDGAYALCHDFTQYYKSKQGLKKEVNGDPPRAINGKQADGTPIAGGLVGEA